MRCCLRQITLHSLVNQSRNPSEDFFTFLVLTSDQLPTKYMDNLNRMLEPYAWAKVVPFPADASAAEILRTAFQNELNRFDEKVCYSTVRLDDDDGVAINFIEELQKYTNPEFDGTCISFGKGLAGIFDETEDAFLSVHDYYQPKIAIGLTYVKVFDPNKIKDSQGIYSIYELGNHTKVDLKAPTILDSRNYIFFRTIHPSSDSTTEVTIKKTRDLPIIKSEVVKRYFSFSPRLFRNSITEVNMDIDKKENLVDDLKKKIDILLNENHSMSSDINKLVNENNLLKKENLKLKKKYKAVVESRSWKYTKPIRVLNDILRRK